MKVLLYVEHDNSALKDATLSAVTAAAELGDVTALVVGHDCRRRGGRGCQGRGHQTGAEGRCRGIQAHSR